MSEKSFELLRETLRKIDGAYAPATVRAYRADFEGFIILCAEHGIEALPGKPEMVAKYIAKLTDEELKSSSIRRAVAAIATIHQINRLPDPTKDPDVKLEMRRMHRRLGRHAKQAQAVNADMLEKLLLATDPGLRGVRDRALLLVAYDTLCRRSEIVSLEYRDLMRKKSGETDCLQLKLRRSKTDQEGLGKPLFLSRAGQDALTEWIDLASISSGFVFRGIGGGNKLTQRLCPGQVNRIFKKLAKNAGLESDSAFGISGHSLRVGGAQDLLRSGASIPLIMAKGRWAKADTVMRYLEHTILEQSEGWTLGGR